MKNTGFLQSVAHQGLDLASDVHVLIDLPLPMFQVSYIGKCGAPPLIGKCGAPPLPKHPSSKQARETRVIVCLIRPVDARPRPHTHRHI
jgi:hypothetical protein